MSINQADATLPEVPGTNNISFDFTDIVIRRPAEDVKKPIAEQRIKLAVNCVCSIEGAEGRLKEKRQSITLDTEDILGLSTAIRAKIKAFVGMCENGCKKQGQTYSNTFDI